MTSFDLRALVVFTAAQAGCCPGLIADQVIAHSATGQPRRSATLATADFTSPIKGRPAPISGARLSNPRGRRMTFIDSPDAPPNPEPRTVWRRPDRVWLVWDGEQWQVIRDFGRMAA